MNTPPYEQPAITKDHIQSKPIFDTPQRPTIQEMCSDCRSLNISVNSFIITRDDSPVQRVTGRPSVNQKPAYTLRTGKGDIKFPTLDVVAGRAKACNLCNFVTKVIKRHDPNIDETGTSLSFRWEVDGHEELGPRVFRNRTRRLRLIWSTAQCKQEAFLVMVAHTSPLAPTTDNGLFSVKSHVFKARDMQNERGKQALIKSWLDICTREHSSACGVATQRDEFRDLLDETFFGVIDVIDLQLKPLPLQSNGSPEKYAALSYVWGKSDKPYVTTRANVVWRRQQGGLEKALHEFPNAIKDAITLCQKLYVRYLWVDALCIVQDSSTSFRLNAAEMHTIYGNAHFTICAADGEDASEKLIAMQSSIGENPAIQESEYVLPGLRLQVARPPEMVIGNTRWNTRGWTFQERILSRRCVIFAGGRIYFQCRKAAFSEDVHNDSKGSGWSLQTMGAPLREFPELAQRSFSFYMKCVSMFYRRDLTRPRDILAAFKGIQSVMELVMLAPFCYGLPTSHFDLALLWQPKRALKRRESTRPHRQEQCTPASDGTCGCQLQGDDFAGQEFPSWSWCGWIDGDVEYDLKALKGCLTDVQSWLSHKTWVRWHVLNGRGKLRPLWDRFLCSEDSSTETRWRGYAARPTRLNKSRAIFDHIPQSDKTDNQARVGITDSTPPVVAISSTYDNVPQRRRTEPAEGSADKGYDFLQTNVKERKEIERRRQHDRDDRRYIREERRPEARSRSRGRHEASGRGRTYEDTTTFQRHDPPQTIDATRIPWSDSLNDYKTSSKEELDMWGRPVRERQLGEPDLDHFNITHPENPYKVSKTCWEWPDQTLEFPDLPVLQFWGIRGLFRIVGAAHNLDTGLSRCDVGDSAGDWCGTVTVSTDWLGSHDGEMCNFIAMSAAESFTEEMGNEWNYYTPSEQGESEWEIVFAMLIVLNDQKHVWERRGIGKIFGTAFSTAGTMEEIMLG